MKASLALLLCLGLFQSVAAQEAVAPGQMPEVQRVRFCERVRDFALQAFYDRQKGRPMKVFNEDGSHGPRITNQIIRRIYGDPGIAEAKQAEEFGRSTCNEMMQATSAR